MTNYDEEYLYNTDLSNADTDSDGLTDKEEVDYGLTNRELQIAKLAAARFTNKEIAEQLYISTETVKSTLKTIFSKLGIGSRNELKKFLE